MLHSSSIQLEGQKLCNKWTFFFLFANLTERKTSILFNGGVFTVALLVVLILPFYHSCDFFFLFGYSLFWIKCAKLKTAQIQWNGLTSARNRHAASFLWSLTDAGLAVRVQRVLLMAAAHWPRVCVITRVLAAAISIVARYCGQAHTQTHTYAGTCTHIQGSTHAGMEVNCYSKIWLWLIVSHGMEMRGKGFGEKEKWTVKLNEENFIIYNLLGE